MNENRKQKIPSSVCESHLQQLDLDVMGPGDGVTQGQTGAGGCSSLSVTNHGGRQRHRSRARLRPFGFSLSRP